MRLQDDAVLCRSLFCRINGAVIVEIDMYQLSVEVELCRAMPDTNDVRFEVVTFLLSQCRTYWLR